ncbi:hypothetical protein [Anaerococcus senegalensis]|uniref:hypothetical protein n=1 Tax=Anaerococcus senegalensis TaxID=1288120 RepID=UPI000302EB71|nr:hypothetical protein [Anaerococcus senegalensis]
MVLIQIALIILKALGYINWSWYLVLAPVIITFLRGMVEGLHEGYKNIEKTINDYETNN